LPGEFLERIQSTMIAVVKVGKSWTAGQLGSWTKGGEKRRKGEEGKRRRGEEGKSNQTT
jgi:hypothetical protein